MNFTRMKFTIRNNRADDKQNLAPFLHKTKTTKLLFVSLLKKEKNYPDMDGWTFGEVSPQSAYQQFLIKNQKLTSFSKRRSKEWKW